MGKETQILWFSDQKSEKKTMFKKYVTINAIKLTHLFVSFVLKW